MSKVLKAPFPYFGGKSLVAARVWQRLGETVNYVEPFFGSGAMLLARPGGAAKIETVNDKNGFVANFWRALQRAPDEVARYADWPVNEAELHARHRWLMRQSELLEQLIDDVDFYDAKIAGWWVWGISQWIGKGWCDFAALSAINRGGALSRRLPQLDNGGQGIHRQLPQLGNGGQGIHRQLPHLGRMAGVHRQLPHLGDHGMGTHRVRLVSTGSSGERCAARSVALAVYFQALADRLRDVRVCCGDWERVCGPCATVQHGLTAVYLDPPYRPAGRDAEIYGDAAPDLNDRVFDWCMRWGDHPLMRIALSGYEGEYDMPLSWTCLAWKAGGGYGLQGHGRGRHNRERERVWFSPHCLQPDLLSLAGV